MINISCTGSNSAVEEMEIRALKAGRAGNSLGGSGDGILGQILAYFMREPPPATGKKMC